MKRVDAIVAIGGGISTSGELSKTSVSRAHMAIDLFKQGLSDKLLFSGRWSHTVKDIPPFTEAEAMRRYALSRKIGESAILLEDRSQDTVSNAYCIKKNHIEINNWDRIAVVTCSAHAARTQLVFSHIFGQSCEVITYPTLEISSREFKLREALCVTAVTSQLDKTNPGDLQSLVQVFGYLSQIEQAA